jgi:hypothetical protein
MDSMKVSKCLFEMITIKEDTKSHTCTPSFLTVSVRAGSSNLVSEVTTLVGRSWILPTRDPRPAIFKWSEVPILCQSFDNHLTNA